MAARGCEVAPYNKVVGTKICLEAKGIRSLGNYTNTKKNNPKVQITTRVVSKEENILCWKQRRWHHATKANHPHAMNKMLKGGFVLQRQILLVPQMKR